MRSTSAVVGVVAGVVALLVGGCTTVENATETASTPVESTSEATSEPSSSGESASTSPDASITATSDGGTGATSNPNLTTREVPPAQLELGGDADAFAARLSDAHATIVDVSAEAGVRERAGVDYQLVLRELADRADLDEVVLGLVDPSARPATERIVGARQFVQQRTASRPSAPPPPDDLPAWTIVAPEAVEVLLGAYREAELLTGIAWYWLAAIHLQETRMGRIEGVSSAGAVGPMQFLPTTWEACCTGDPTVTRDAIIGAATYLAQSGGPTDMAAALYQYNPNDGYVAVVTAYAESLRDEPELYTGYHAFQVFYATSVGTVRLPVGYSTTVPVDAATYLTANPTDAA